LYCQLSILYFLYFSNCKNSNWIDNRGNDTNSCCWKKYEKIVYYVEQSPIILYLCNNYIIFM